MDGVFRAVGKIKKAALYSGFVMVILLFGGVKAEAAAPDEGRGYEPVIREVVEALMTEHRIPGMSVALTVNGERYFFNHGLASKESGRLVDEETIFEVGSVSKTFTATLAAYAEKEGALSLADKAAKYRPALAGSPIGEITLLELGTYSAGGLPLQFPEAVTNLETMIAYYKNWRPVYSPGTHRLYSNPSIGLFGYLAAESLGESFDDLMEKKIFPGLGLVHTFIKVPPDQMANYAYGYSKENRPIRVNPGVLDSEAYGVKTTAADLIRFVEMNMEVLEPLDQRLGQAVTATQTGYFSVGGLIQGLGWEMYAYPVNLETLLAGNSSEIIMKANPVERLNPPQPPNPDQWINKTGSTNGFGAYVVFIPAKKTGLVMLANKNYPNAERVKAAYQILKSLDKGLEAETP